MGGEQPAVDRGHPSQPAGALGQVNASVRVHRGEIERGARQPRPAVRGRILGVHLVEVGGVDKRTGGGQQLGVAGELASAARIMQMFGCAAAAFRVGGAGESPRSSTATS
ncbi:hypothetical protein [Streptomyces violaceusniger]|uniref:hypothetical protein n=1 Tax=Streptomyces violaceusniger TaxID=68280 RepID=UPI003694D547